MTEQQGPWPGEARGDGRRPPPLAVSKVLRPEGTRAVWHVVLRSWFQGDHGPRPMFWTVAVRPDGMVVRTMFNGADCAPASLPGVVLDLARTIALDAMGVRRRGWGCS